MKKSHSSDALKQDRSNCQQKQIYESETMIEIKLIPTNYFTRWGCTVCGGRTEKDAILCEGETENVFVRVCPQCLKSPELIDEKLEGRAVELESLADGLRSIKGELVLPSYGEWEAATEKLNDEWRALSYLDGGDNEPF